MSSSGLRILTQGKGDRKMEKKTCKKCAYYDEVTGECGYFGAPPEAVEDCTEFEDFERMRE